MGIIVRLALAVAFATLAPFHAAYADTATTTPTATGCNAPAQGTLNDIMQRAVWTTLAGNLELGTPWRSQIEIALPQLAAFDCLRWEVTALLPHGIEPDADANGGTYALSASMLTSVSRFVAKLKAAPGQPAGRHWTRRGWLQVRVRHVNAEAGVWLHTDTGSPLWLYPVDFHAH